MERVEFGHDLNKCLSFFSAAGWVLFWFQNGLTTATPPLGRSPGCGPRLACFILKVVPITIWPRTASASRQMVADEQDAGKLPTHLTFLLNFFDELRRRAPATSHAGDGGTPRKSS